MAPPDIPTARPGAGTDRSWPVIIYGTPRSVEPIRQAHPNIRAGSICRCCGQPSGIRQLRSGGSSGVAWWPGPNAGGRAQIQASPQPLEDRFCSLGVALSGSGVRLCRIQQLCLVRFGQSIGDGHCFLLFRSLSRRGRRPPGGQDGALRPAGPGRSPVPYHPPPGLSFGRPHPPESRRTIRPSGTL